MTGPITRPMRAVRRTSQTSITSMKSVILSVCVSTVVPPCAETLVASSGKRSGHLERASLHGSRRLCRPCRENASIARWVAVIQAQVQTAANYKTKPSIKSLMPVRCLKNRKFRTPALIGPRQGLSGARSSTWSIATSPASSATIRPRSSATRRTGPRLP
jgi:hypothetical protein